MDFSDSNLTNVIIIATLTAVATGLGAIPFFFLKNISNKSVSYANALAAGLMLSASFKLLEEGVNYDLFRCILGLIIGLVMIHFGEQLFNNEKEFNIGQLKGANAIKAFLIVGVMTLHSIAEGVGVGVSFSGEEGFGMFISSAIAIHNIPEGLAICIVLVPKKVKPFKAMLWSIFSSLPQPIIAIPAFLFVETFQKYLPVGLGIASGAMIWMVFSEIVPDALENGSRKNIALIVTSAIGAMIIFQELIQV